MQGDAYLFSPPRRVQWWGSLVEQPLPARSLNRNSRSRLGGGLLLLLGVGGVPNRTNIPLPENVPWDVRGAQVAWHGGGRAGEALLVQTCGFRARCRSPGSTSRPMLRGVARRRCPQGAAVSRAVASAASAAGWAQTPPWGGQASWIQLHSPYFQVFLNDERDRNETEAQNLKLHVFIVHSLHQRLDLVGGSCDSRQVNIHFVHEL